MSPRNRIARPLLAGDRRGLAASLLRAVLLCLTPLFRLALVLRRGAYAVGLRRVHRAPVPVVSVGNLTVGGTGKTPLVADLVRRLERMGRRPAVVSRGYGARPGRPSDEALLLRRAVPSLRHIEDPVRIRGARRAAAEGADAIVLDDGFQHWACHRDLDLVAVDATCPFGYGHLLPRGLLREPLSALRRADVVVVTRADQIEEDALDALTRRLEALAPDAAHAVARHAPRRVVQIGGSVDERPPDALRGVRVLAFSGLGHPEAFERTLVDLGARVVATARHGDHHDHEPRDLEAARRQAREAGAERIVTTTKDAVKLEKLEGSDDADDLPVDVLEIEIEFLRGEDLLEARLLEGVGS